jgi:acyl-coenzyme A thioesterase 13
VSGSLHGGAVALIFDICTSTALTACAKEGFWDTGHVSRDLNCRYLRPVPAGQKIWIESEVVHLGKRLASLTGRIKNEDGKVCYICDHQKAAVGASAL